MAGDFLGRQTSNANFEVRNLLCLQHIPQTHGGITWSYEELNSFVF